MNSQRFFTTGCSGKNSSDLPQLLETHEAVLADIRLSSPATNEEFAQRQLENLLGRKYHRVTHLGNLPLRSGEMSVAHLSLGLQIILSWEINVILMCECAELEQCHRSLIAHELRRGNLFVQEMTDWRPPQY